MFRNKHKKTLCRQKLFALILLKVMFEYYKYCRAESNLFTVRYHLVDQIWYDLTASPPVLVEPLLTVVMKPGLAVAVHEV